MKQILTKIGVFLLAAVGASPLLAVPARQVARDVVQPDGSVVTLTLCGDEYFHFFKTTDGLIVKEQQDGWYRIVGNDGIATDMPALNPQERSAAQVQRIADINAAVAFDKLRSSVMTTSSKRQAYRQERLAPKRNVVSKAFEPAWDNSDGHYLRAFPAEGEQNVLIILVSFADKDWSYCSDPHKEMQAMLQEEGYSNYSCTGSAYDYFVESSRGVFRPKFDVYGPVKLPNNIAYYGANDSYGSDMHPEKMVTDACSLLDAEVDFSQYDRDGDGVVDNIYIFYAGYGEADGGSTSTVWPHSWDIRYAEGTGNVMHDGVVIGHYACSNELNYRNQMTGIGTFCHEFSHVLGLPDLYATTYTSAVTPGEYSLMDQGSYNNNGRTPPIYSGYERYALEWQKPVVITKDEYISTRALTDGGNFYKMTVSANRPTEYFIFENRQPIGNDVTLPGKGMLVWRINYDETIWNNNVVNNTSKDERVDIIEADSGESDNDFDGGATFPGASGNTEFTASSYPAFANKSGTKSSLGITNISVNNDGILSFVVGKGMTEDSDNKVAKPQVRPASISSDSFTVYFSDNQAQAKAKGTEADVDNTLTLSVESYAYDEEEQMFVSKVLEGYSLLRVPADAPFEVTDVNSSTTYTVKVYRETDTNISEPATISILTAGETIADTHTTLAVANITANTADLNWAEIDGADHYLVTVATREIKPSTESLTVDFAGSPRVPSGWDDMGSYTSQSGNFGTSAPAFYMSEKEDYLWTEYYEDKEIESVEFWGKISDDTKSLGLDLYTATENGSLTLISPIEGLSSKGQKFTIDMIPDGTHSLVFIPTNISTNTKVIIDDLTIRFRGETIDTPVADYDDMNISGSVINLHVKGLEANSEYVAYVKGHDGTEEGGCSNVVKFYTADPSGINSISGDDNASAGFYVGEDGVLRCMDAETAFDVFAIDGTMLAKDARGYFQLPTRGIYVVLAGGKAMKICY